MSRYYNDISYSPAVLQHSGIKGMHWHERRYQNEDGTLTEEGKKRYSKSLNKISNLDSKASKAISKTPKLDMKAAKISSKASKHYQKALKKEYGTFFSDPNVQAANKYKKKYSKEMAKAGKLSYKSEKLKFKASKYSSKGQKIASKLNSDFKDVKTSDLDEELINKARKYTHTLAA